MSTAAAASPAAREPDLAGQTVVVIGGSAGIGLEAARRARAEGAGVILAGRDSARLQQAASELGALDTATFDANDPVALAEFFEHLPGPVDHVMVTAGRPYYARLNDMDFEQARRALQGSAMLMLGVARYPRPGGQPGPGDRADPGERGRRSLRRHTPVGIDSRRRAHERRIELRTTLPIGRVVGPADVAALAMRTS